MDARLKQILAILGVDRPVVKTETLPDGTIRVTLLGGDSFEVSLERQEPAPKTKKKGRPA